MAYSTVSAVSGSKNAITGRAVPGLHIMRRMISDYRPGGHDATVTIVYRTYANINVRWFRKAEQRLPNSEIPDMLTVEGCSLYYYLWILAVSHALHRSVFPKSSFCANILLHKSSPTRLLSNQLITQYGRQTHGHIFLILIRSNTRTHS